MGKNQRLQNAHKVHLSLKGVATSLKQLFRTCFLFTLEWKFAIILVRKERLMASFKRAWDSESQVG